MSVYPVVVVAVVLPGRKGFRVNTFCIIQIASSCRLQLYDVMDATDQTAQWRACSSRSRLGTSEMKEQWWTADEANWARERARERLSNGSCAAATMATNKKLLRIFPLLWNWRFFLIKIPWLSIGASSPSFLSLFLGVYPVILLGGKGLGLARPS